MGAKLIYNYNGPFTNGFFWQQHFFFLSLPKTNIIKDKWAATEKQAQKKKRTIGQHPLSLSCVVKISLYCIPFEKSSNILCIFCTAMVGRIGGWGNGYFSKLLIISFLCPLNEGYKVNTWYNKANGQEGRPKALHIFNAFSYTARKNTSC